jgi:hypothetical protein
MTSSTQDVRATMAAHESAVEIPSDFICPITLQVMVSPVMTRTGLNFERAAIFDWLEQGSGSCPLTRKPLTASDLIPDRRLKTQISIWRANNAIPEPTQEEMEAAECKFVGFLKVSGGKKGKIQANFPDHIIPPPSSLRRAGRRSRHSRQSGEQRRSFLSRILTSAAA